MNFTSECCKNVFIYFTEQFDRHKEQSKYLESKMNDCDNEEDLKILKIKNNKQLDFQLGCLYIKLVAEHIVKLCFKYDETVKMIKEIKNRIVQSDNKKLKKELLSGLTHSDFQYLVIDMNIKKYYMLLMRMIIEFQNDSLLNN